MLRPDQVHLVRKIHRTLGEDIESVLDFFHKRTSQILTPQQVTTVHQAAIELVNNVHKEKIKAQKFLKESAHTDAQMKTHKD